MTATAFAAGLTLSAGTADANIVFTAVQGLQQNGSPVAADRSVTANMLDGNTNTMYSLGLGGTLKASIAPLLIASASVIEITIGNNTSFPESTKLYLGDDTVSGTLLGELFNTASGSSTTSSGAGGSSVTTSSNTPSTGLTSFQIALGSLSGTSSSLFFVDTTSTRFSNLVDNSDGFDIAELRISAVPLPAGVLLLGLGLAGMVGVRRIQAGRKAA